MEPAIRVDNLKFSYGGAEVLHGISFEIRCGEVTGLLGPNGAGKSTTLKILTGILQVQSGRVAIDGYDLPEQSLQVKKRIGYVPEAAELYESLSAMEFLELCGRLHEIEEAALQNRIGALLESSVCQARSEAVWEPIPKECARRSCCRLRYSTIRPFSFSTSP